MTTSSNAVEYIGRLAAKDELLAAKMEAMGEPNLAVSIKLRAEDYRQAQVGQLEYEAERAEQHGLPESLVRYISECDPYLHANVLYDASCANTARVFDRASVAILILAAAVLVALVVS